MAGNAVKHFLGKRMIFSLQINKVSGCDWREELTGSPAICTPHSGSWAGVNIMYTTLRHPGRGEYNEECNTHTHTCMYVYTHTHTNHTGMVLHNEEYNTHTHTHTRVYLMKNVHHTPRQIGFSPHCPNCSRTPRIKESLGGLLCSYSVYPSTFWGMVFMEAVKFLRLLSHYAY